MKSNFNQQAFQKWLKNFKAVCKQLAIPFCVFQAVRTFIFPSAFDVLLLALLVGIAFAFHNDWL